MTFGAIAAAGGEQQLSMPVLNAPCPRADAQANTGLGAAASEFRGRLHVFVDVPRDGKLELDEFFGAREPGEKLWYLTGWAVGNNARGSYCARTSAGRLRAFATFAAAMDFVRRKRKSRPDQRFYLVYELGGRQSIVNSLAQIERIDSDDAAAASAGSAADPTLDRLAQKVGKIVAGNALELLRILEAEGEAAARARFSAATYERLQRVLHDAALVAAAPSLATQGR